MVAVRVWLPEYQVFSPSVIIIYAYFKKETPFTLSLGCLLAQLGDHVTFDLRVRSLSLMVGIEFTLKKKLLSLFFLHSMPCL